MNSYIRYIIISVLSSTLSTTYINTLHKKHLNSITDELNSQCEENKILREKSLESPTVDTVLKNIDKCLILLVEKINNLEKDTIDEKTIQKIDLTCNKVLNIIQKNNTEDISSSESFESLID